MKDMTEKIFLNDPSELGFIKAAAISPAIAVANPFKNAAAAVASIKSTAEAGAQLIVLPELFLTGCTCGDLYYSSALISGAEDALAQIMSHTESIDALILIGLPAMHEGRLYSCAAALHRGKLLGAVPKAEHGEALERWFSPAPRTASTITLCGQEAPFGDILFRLAPDVSVGVVFGDELSAPMPRDAELALSGAGIIAVMSASNDIVGSNEYTRQLLLTQSARLSCAYVYSSPSPGESSTDFAFSGFCAVTENGHELCLSERFTEDTSAIACVDVQQLGSERRKSSRFRSSGIAVQHSVISCPTQPLRADHIDRSWEPFPFVPADKSERDKRCSEILSIQCAGLAKRMTHTGMKKAVVGISGGLDSTLALLVCVRTADLLGLPRENVICITMPGFGTTDQTYNNAVELIRSVGGTFMEISIRDACLQHFRDIGHDSSEHDVTYENTQARERTQILMDVANKHNALLVGTGDLSEMAMGWCTYNGDHMSMYSVNAGIPKTLVRYLVENWAAGSDAHTAQVLRSILDTPVSPELLPPDETGKIQQKTEEKIGPYELHDFYLYYFVRFGFKPEKLMFMAERAFAGKYSGEEIKKWLTLFLRRFFISQFKRSCVPDGPKVGSIGFSPRGDWHMPSDAEYSLWLTFAGK